MSKLAYIISLNFNPGHISHIIAGYKQMEEIGYESVCLIHPRFVDFLPAKMRCTVYGDGKIKPCAVAMFLFPSEKNIVVMLRLKLLGKVKILYLFHEPLDKIKSYWTADKNIIRILRIYLIGIVNAITVFLSDFIILPSKKALELYDDNKIYFNNRILIPLMFDDEYSENYRGVKRKYISYIGTVTSDHAFEEFISCIYYLINEGLYPGVDFLIATRSSLDYDKRIEAMMSTNRLKIISGTPLSNDLINLCYAESLVIWNAYNRTTQSGVLVKAFMFGVPALVMNNNVSEYVTHGGNAFALFDNKNKIEIVEALDNILSNREVYSLNCIRTFNEHFYYRKYNETMSSII